MMSWDNGSVIKLIEAYKEKEVIWNPRHRNYYNRLLKKDAWDELATELQRPLEDIKKKMEYLLAALRREKQKMAKSKTTGQGTDDVYRSSWFAYPHMLFLLDRNKPRDRLNTEDLTEDEEEKESSEESAAFENQSPGNQAPENNSPESQAPGSQIPVTQVSATAKFKHPGPLKKTQKSLPQKDPILSEALQLMRSSAQAATSALTCTASSSAVISDRYQIYANYLASKFRTYSQRAFITVEHEINNILYYADTGQYDWDRGYQSTYSDSNSSQTLTQTSMPNQHSANYEPTANQSTYNRTPTPAGTSNHSEQSLSPEIYDTNSRDTDDFSDLIRFQS